MPLLTTPASAFAVQLAGRGHGLPLWHPETVGEGEIEIGDVGFLNGGSFIRLFNVVRLRDRPSHTTGVLQDIAEMPLGEEHSVPEHTRGIPPGPLCTATVVHKEFEKSQEASETREYAFDWRGSTGAIAILLESGKENYVTGSRIRQYLCQHHSSWYQAARELGYDIQDHEIILVTGWLKTSLWVISTFRRFKRPKSPSLSLRMNHHGILGPTFTITNPSNVQVSLEQRWGPHRTALSNEPQANTVERSRNQTLFLRYHKLRRRSTHRKPEPREQDSQTGSTSSPTCTEMPFACISKLVSGLRALLIPRAPWVEEGPYDEDIDPLDPVLDYILEKSDASAAVASYDDVYKSCPPHDSCDNIDQLLRKHRPSVAVDGDGVGWIETLSTHTETSTTSRNKRPRRDFMAILSLIRKLSSRSCNGFPRRHSKPNKAPTPEASARASDVHESPRPDQNDLTTRDASIETRRSPRLQGAWPSTMGGLFRRSCRRTRSASQTSSGPASGPSVEPRLVTEGSATPDHEIASPSSATATPPSAAMTQVILATRADDGDRFTDARLAELSIPLHFSAESHAGSLAPDVLECRGAAEHAQAAATARVRPGSGQRVAACRIT